MKNNILNRTKQTNESIHNINRIVRHKQSVWLYYVNIAPFIGEKKKKIIYNEILWIKSTAAATTKHEWTVNWVINKKNKIEDKRCARCASESTRVNDSTYVFDRTEIIISSMTDMCSYLATHSLNEIFSVPYPEQLHQIDGVNVIHDLFSN